MAATEFDRTAWNCVSGGLGLSLGRFSSPGGGQALEQAARVDGGVTVPGGGHEPLRCCTEGHGLMGNISDR